ncbi:DWNN domain-containing protein [Limtongia smithiae]|uniref:DWNN domain-containing protein n=1 Tax=Limtongia smithiae TaxID=1125753 RepID=UPI0034CDC9CC
MSSFIYYKFRSQKDPKRITFDGTGITVFDLKREIIALNKLGEGTDFDLSIYNADTSDEYDDDGEILPRSSSVVVRRRAPVKLGRGTAARYVGAKAVPVMGASAYGSSAPGRRPGLGIPGEGLQRRPGSQATTSSAPKRSGDGTEDDMINAMFEAQSESWNNTQEKMAGATPVYGRPSVHRQKPAPDYPPPPTYICHRCGKKGHWIQACPTNSDPNFEYRRLKRTTGIPKSFLKTVSKDEMSALEGADGSVSDRVRMNENGEFVVVQPDRAAWSSYLQKQTMGGDHQGNGEADGSDGEHKRKRTRRTNADG